MKGSTNPSDWGSVPTSYSDSNWDAAICNWSANGFRLPTESEWEYACRGGTSSMYYWSNSYDEATTKQYCWFLYNCGGSGSWTTPHADKGGTQPVGTRLPNAFGLYDMSGNVWEWCWDWYGSYPISPTNDPKGSVAVSFRVLRGGCWDYYGSGCRSANRNWSNPGGRGSYLGFRLVRTK
ncbi:MAG: formylglycine-generating enzyme family protein [Candidatus Riflebacteria bacterium]|nr:formylglycine-generating enzyme family protein [Candidatus Riflebacteria bacterium]